MKKTNMKKVLLTLIAALLAFVMCFAFVGCSKDSDDDKDEDKDNKTSVSDKADKDEDKDTEDKEDEEDEEDDKKPADDDDEALAVAEHYAEAYLIDYDAEEAFENVLDEAFEAMGYTRDEFVADFQETLDYLAENEIEYEYTIIHVVDSDLDDIAGTYESFDLEVEDCVIYEVEASIIGMEESQETYEISVVLIDGEWYLDPFNTTL